MKNAKMTICLMAAVLVVATGQVFGLTEYKDGETHNISSVTNDDVWVDYQSPDMQTTVNLLEGGIIGKSWNQPRDLQGYNNSRINIFEGSALRDLSVFDSSQATVSGGNFTCGDGPEGIIRAYNNSQVTISGGAMRDINAYGNSRITMSSGSLVGRSYANDNSQILISGGSLGEMLIASGNGQIAMSNGQVGELIGYDYSRLTMFGGFADFINAFGNSQITMSGGRVGMLQAFASGQLTIDGSNFAINGSPISFGQYFASDFDHGILTGTLANGDIINTQFSIADNASITFIPEPASLLLLALGVLALHHRRKLR